MTLEAKSDANTSSPSDRGPVLNIYRTNIYCRVSDVECTRDDLLRK